MTPVEQYMQSLRRPDARPRFGGAASNDRFRPMAVFFRRVGLSRKRTFRAVLRRREMHPPLA